MLLIWIREAELRVQERKSKVKSLPESLTVTLFWTFIALILELSITSVSLFHKHVLNVDPRD